MSPETHVSGDGRHRLLTPAERDELELTALVRQRLEEQFESLEHQHEAASLGMWAFLATEVLFFGTLFVGLGIYCYLYHPAFEKASEKLNWLVGGINTVVLLVSSLFMALAVHSASTGDQRRLRRYLVLTAFLGACFLVLKGYEYYTDYRDNLIPGWRFDEAQWTARDGLRPEQVQHVKLFLLFYWIMTGFHGLHVTIGVGVILVLWLLARNGRFTPAYYSPIDVAGLYWHFVDVVWIFLLPMLYLLGTHTRVDLHF